MKDINLKEGTITVNKAIRFDGNRPVISAPKTASGTRQVPILSILRPYLENRTGRILSAKNGDIMTEQSFTRCWASYILHLSKAAGHPVTIRPHDLRHTYCTMLRDSGVDMHQAMLWMGHSDEKMILHIYDHVSEKRTQSVKFCLTFAHYQKRCLRPGIPRSHFCRISVAPGCRNESDFFI